MVFIIGFIIIFLVTVLLSQIFMDLFIKRMHDFHFEEWERQGSPCGTFYQPEDAKRLGKFKMVWYAHDKIATYGLIQILMLNGMIVYQSFSTIWLWLKLLLAYPLFYFY